MYVWGSYGLAVAIFLYNYCVPLVREKKLLRRANKTAADKFNSPA